jgi:hypothetical protein
MALIKLRQLGERLAQQVASRFGVFTSIEESQLALIRRLETEGLIEREVAGLFHDLRITGNTATHGLQGDHATALSSLKIAWQLGVPPHVRRTGVPLRAVSSPPAAGGRKRRIEAGAGSAPRRP